MTGVIAERRKTGAGTGRSFRPPSRSAGASKPGQQRVHARVLVNGMMPTMLSTGFVIIGAGFAGASTAWALARLGEGPGLILERESSVGVHASGRNAGLLKIY